MRLEWSKPLLHCSGLKQLTNFISVSKKRAEIQKSNKLEYIMNIKTFIKKLVKHCHIEWIKTESVIMTQGNTRIVWTNLINKIKLVTVVNSEDMIEYAYFVDYPEETKSYINVNDMKKISEIIDFLFHL